MYILIYVIYYHVKDFNLLNQLINPLCRSGICHLPKYWSKNTFSETQGYTIEILTYY